jgi:predicted small lipoprotein YifL
MNHNPWLIDKSYFTGYFFKAPLLSILLTFFLSACGQSGNLYLPDSKKAAVSHQKTH